VKTKKFTFFFYLWAITDPYFLFYKHCFSHKKKSFVKKNHKWNFSYCIINRVFFLCSANKLSVNQGHRLTNRAEAVGSYSVVTCSYGLLPKTDSSQALLWPSATLRSIKRVFSSKFLDAPVNPPPTHTRTGGASAYRSCVQQSPSYIWQRI
jgi:hypothetical protein